MVHIVGAGCGAPDLITLRRTQLRDFIDEDRKGHIGGDTQQ